jgi:putative ABC transport system ATP-binding protein
MKHIIETSKLGKVYREEGSPVVALEDLNLCFDQGEFTAVVGPSGSGKTTFLNMIGGLDVPTSGSVIIGDQELGMLKDSRLVEFRLKNIGFVFQAYNLIPVLTARENVEFIMMLQHCSRQQRSCRSKELLEAVGLADRMDSRPSKLSGGQQQRVAVARALASRPKFILADEPTANLDSKSAEVLLEIMDRLNKEEKMTFIFSTHDPRVVKRARRVITLVDGKVESDVLKQAI